MKGLPFFNFYLFILNWIAPIWLNGVMDEASRRKYIVHMYITVIQTIQFFYYLLYFFLISQLYCFLEAAILKFSLRIPLLFNNVIFSLNLSMRCLLMESLSVINSIIWVGLAFASSISINNLRRMAFINIIMDLIYFSCLKRNPWHDEIQLIFQRLYLINVF